MSAFRLDDNDPKLTEEEHMVCEGRITKDECLTALKGMAKDKAPGITGFTAEFYVSFWDEFGDIIIEYINEAFEREQFFVNHVRGIIHLIPKKGDQMQLKNKRPICLIDVLYKIVAKVLASRLSIVLSRLISHDQTGFVRGRFIGENLRIVSDIISYCEEENMEGILLTVDFRSAFDTLERDFMMYALRSFNFGNSFCSWIKLLFSGAQLTVVNDGFTSKWFPCERGTFQGSPISGMLFILSIEMLANRIRRSQDVEGISINGVEVKVSLYADDMTIFLRNERSLAACLSILDEFRIASGLEINFNKTKMMWIGAWKNRRDSCNGIQAEVELKILGTKFSATKNCYKDNMESVKEKITRVINSWNQRSLTIKGRITIAKSLIMSHIIYFASICTFERTDLDAIQANIMRFIWRGRPPKVAKRVLWQDTAHGGLNAPCIGAIVRALRVVWARRIHISHDSSWRRILQARIGEFPLDNLFKGIKSQLALRKWRIPQFYKDVIHDFQMLNEMKVKTGSDVRQSIILNLV